MRKLKQWERHALKFVLGYLVWTVIWLVNYGILYLWIPSLVMLPICYLTGVLFFWLVENVFAGFFKPLHQTIEAKREYKRWREGKKREGGKRR